MQQWERDPAYQAVVRGFIDGDPLEQAGGPLDVRAVVAGLGEKAKAKFLLDEVDWSRFPERGRVREAVEWIATCEDAAISRALRVLAGLCANDMRAAVAPSVPFLIRTAADPLVGDRPGVLAVLAMAARMRHFGMCSRADVLRFRRDDEWSFEVTGCLQNWSVQAAHDTIATDADLLLPLLDDPDMEVRISSAYVLAAAGGRAEEILAAFRTCLPSEADPAVRACLVLAVSELARAHNDVRAAEWTLAWWSDPMQPPEVWVSAALGWLCLTELPVPDGLRVVMDVVAEGETARRLASLPWLRSVENADGNGLVRCLRTMVHDDPTALEKFDEGLTEGLGC